MLSNAGSILTYGGTLTLNIATLIADGNYDLFNFTTESGPTARNFGLVQFFGAGYMGTFSDSTNMGIWSAMANNNQFFEFTESTGNLVVSAVPEPSTFAMLLGGAGMLTLLRRRRR